VVAKSRKVVQVQRTKVGEQALKVSGLGPIICSSEAGRQAGRRDTVGRLALEVYTGALQAGRYPTGRQEKAGKGDREVAVCRCRQAAHREGRHAGWCSKQAAGGGKSAEQ